MLARTKLARQLRQSSTSAERCLWHHLRAHRLTSEKFKRQHPIGSYIVDFGCRKRHLIVKLDGAHHQTQLQADRQRTRFLEALGYIPCCDSRTTTS